MTLSLAALASDYAVAEAQLRELVVTDPLTGLPNYRRLLEVLQMEIARADRHSRQFAVVFFDMDGLKRINDELGHLIGSRAVCRFAETLRAACRETDTPARYGGDEFVAVLSDTDHDGANSSSKRTNERLQEDTDQPRLSVSAGIAVYPRDGGTPTTLLSAADRALYANKADKAQRPPPQRGRNAGVDERTLTGSTIGMPPGRSCHGTRALRVSGAPSRRLADFRRGWHATCSDAPGGTSDACTPGCSRRPFVLAGSSRATSRSGQLGLGRRRIRGRPRWSSGRPSGFALAALLVVGRRPGRQSSPARSSRCLIPPGTSFSSAPGRRRPHARSRRRRGARRPLRARRARPSRRRDHLPVRGHRRRWPRAVSATFGGLATVLLGPARWVTPATSG